MARKVLFVIVSALLCGLVVFAALKSFNSEDATTHVPKGPEKPEPGEGPPEPVIEFVEDAPSRAIEGNVAGMVVDPAGKPVRGARVVLHGGKQVVSEAIADRFRSDNIDIEELNAELEGMKKMLASRALYMNTVTDADGWFSFEVATGGPFTVSASNAGYAPAVAMGVKPGMKNLLLRLIAAGGVKGTVVDDTGAPVPGAKISAGDESPTTAAGAGGEFRLTDLPAGVEATITASAKGYGSSTATILVRAGKVSELDNPLVLLPSPGIIGRVVDPKGEPIDGVRVSRGNGFLGRVDGSRTRKDGRFHLEVEEGGKFDLTFRHEEYLPKTVEGVSCAKDERRRLEDVRLEPGGEIVGTVLAPGGKPVVDARVIAMPKDTGSDWSRMIEAGMGGSRSPETQRDGSYRVAGLAEGVYTLIIRSDGFVPFEKQDVVVRVPEKTTVDVTLSLGASISGRVLDSGGKPRAGAKVEASYVAQAVNMRDIMIRGDWSAEAETGADGTFRLTGFDDRPARISASAAGYVSRTLTDVDPGTAALEIRLIRCGTITGRVLDSETDEPLAGARVQVLGPGPRPSAETDDTGEFTLIQVAPGTCELRGDADDHAPATVKGIELAEAGLAEGVVIRLGKGATLSGIVVAASDGQPVKGARVRVSGPAARNVESEETGRFEIGGLTPGHYELNVHHAKFAGTKLESVPVPSTGELRVALSRGGSVRGVVRDADGNPLSGRMVMLSVGADFGGNMATTKADGTFSFERLTPGKYTAIVMNWGGGGNFEMQTQSRTVTVVEGEEAFLELGGTGKGTAARLTGRLMDRGVPLGSRMMILIKADAGGGMAELMASFKMITTDEEGQYDIAELEPGKYRVFTGMMGGQEQGVGMDLEVTEAGEIKQDIVLPEGRLAGRVTRAETGKPVQGAKIMLVDAALASRPAVSLADILGAMLAQSVSGSDGTFEIPNAPPGTHLVQVLTSGLAPVSIEGVRVTEQGGSPLAVSVRKGFKVTVAVLNSQGAPVSGASALLFDDKGRRYMVPDNLNDNTKSDGTVDLRLASGSYIIHVQKQGLAPESRRVTVSRDDTVEFSLTPGGAAHLTVVSSGPVAGATVRIFRDDGREIAWHITQESMMSGMGDTKTDESGQLRIENVPAGTHRFVAVAPDGTRGEANVRITEGGQQAAVIRVK